MEVKKKTGVGYGTDSSTNQVWDVTKQQEARKEEFDQILGLLKILEQFLDCKEFTYPENILETTFESSLMPILESSLRGGSLLEISKYAELFQGELNFILVMAKHKNILPIFLPLPASYQPKQP